MSNRIAELKDRLQHALYIREKKAADLSKDLNIPKSAISQYLSGKSQNMDSRRLYAICQYLDVSEAWLMGFDVPMERTMQQKNDILSDAVIRMRNDADFFSLVETLYKLDADQIRGVKQMISTFIK